MRVVRSKTKATIIEQHQSTVFRVKLEDREVVMLGYVANRFRVPRKGGKGMGRPRITLGEKVWIEIIDEKKCDIVGFVDSWQN